MPDDTSVRSDPARRPDPDPTILTTAALLREIGNLKEHFNSQLDGLTRIFDARVMSIEKAAEKAAADYTRVPTEVQKAVSGLQALHEEKFTSVDNKFEETVSLRNAKFESIQQQFAERDIRTDTAHQEARHALELALKAALDNVEEKFRSIQTQFVERDTRVEQTARDTRVAVDAALQAAEKAVNKQNESFAVSIAKSEMAQTKQSDQQSTLIQTATGNLDGKISDLKDRVTRIEGATLGQAGAQRDTHSASTLVIAIIAVIFSALSAAAAWVHTALR